MKYAGAAVWGMVLLACGCGPGVSEVPEQERIATLSAEVVRLGRTGLRQAECGPPASHRPQTLVFATADLCLSCLEAGALLRDLTRRGLSGDGAVITPTAHAREVCDYLRNEKVRWRVVGIAEDRLPADRAPRGIVYFELEPDGRIRRREHAATPLELAEIIIPKRDAAEAASVHPQQGGTR